MHDHFTRKHFTHFTLLGPLRYLESEEHYSVYLDRDGEEVCLGAGGFVVVDLDDLDYLHLWQKWVRHGGGHRYETEAFRQLLRSWTMEPGRVDDEVEFCNDCQTPNDVDELYGTGHGTTVCEGCYEAYWMCDCCEASFSTTTTTLHETEVCDDCRNHNYTHCDYCEGYYLDEYSGDHYHEDGDGAGCCDSPAMSFSIRNDGGSALQNDVITTVTLAAGVISEEGLAEISNYLFAQSFGWEESAQSLRHVANRIHELGNQWQTKQGNFTKRLSRFAYKEYGLKITPELMSQIGSIASSHSGSVDLMLAVTRDLNQSPDEFSHKGSCWWGSEYQSRCALKTNGGFGVRTFETVSWRTTPAVTGRAWVLPLRLDGSGYLQPTFETMEPDAFVVFNGYESLSGYTPARVLAHMTGTTYRKVNFECYPMYINSDSGYLVGREEVVAPYTNGHLSLSVDQHSGLYRTETQELAHV